MAIYVDDFQPEIIYNESFDFGCEEMEEEEEGEE